MISSDNYQKTNLEHKKSNLHIDTIEKLCLTEDFQQMPVPLLVDNANCTLNATDESDINILLLNGTVRR